MLGKICLIEIHKNKLEKAELCTNRRKGDGENFEAVQKKGGTGFKENKFQWQQIEHRNEEMQNMENPRRVYNGNSRLTKINKFSKPAVNINIAKTGICLQPPE